MRGNPHGASHCRHRAALLGVGHQLPGHQTSDDTLARPISEQQMIVSEGSKPCCYSIVKGDGVMLTLVTELFRQAPELDEHDRATLAGLLLESFEHEDDEGVETAWKEEIERHLAELDADCVQLMPWDEMKAKLMRRTGAKRSA